MTSTEPVVDGPEPVPKFEPIDFTVTEADTIKRQWADELWDRALQYRARP